MQCASCQGTGEHLFFIQTQHPPGTPSQVRMACNECLGFGVIHQDVVGHYDMEVRPCAVVSS